MGTGGGGLVWDRPRRAHPRTIHSERRTPHPKPLGARHVRARVAKSASGIEWLRMATRTPADAAAGVGKASYSVCRTPCE